MGGPGSGRRQQYGKRTTSDFRSLDIRLLHQENLIRPGQVFSWQWLRNGEEISSIQIRVRENNIVLDYQNRNNCGQWESVCYSVQLDWSECNLGGKRAWFLCPSFGCRRRVAILYSGRKFVCRHCNKLAYSSQRENPEDRALRRAGKIRKKLGWEPGIANGKGFKPKGMHWKTFEELNRQHNGFAKQANSYFAKWLRGINIIE